MGKSFLGGDSRIICEFAAIYRLRIRCYLDFANPLLFTDLTNPLLFTDFVNPLLCTDFENPLLFTGFANPLLFTDFANPLPCTDFQCANLEHIPLRAMSTLGNKKYDITTSVGIMRIKYE